MLDETDGRKAKNVTGPGGDLLPARQPRLQFRDSRSHGGYGDDRPRRPRYDRSYEGGDSSYGDRPRGRSSPRQARGDDEYAEDMSYAERPQRRAQVSDRIRSGHVCAAGSYFPILPALRSRHISCGLT